METDGPRRPPAGCSGAVAIIGMAGRFPGAPDVDAFWRNLAGGVESVTEFSEEEILACGVDPALAADPNYVRKGVVLEGADLFDAEFFGFNPLEAQVIDPQQRVFLECAWEAIENAGYAADTGRGAVGVFAGVGMNTYLFSNLLANRAALEAVGPYQLMLASDKDFLSTRVCYKLDLTGPGVTVQTACSTSLVAVQMACQSLLAGQCDVALAGGVSIPFPAKSGYLYSEGMILSPDGHCRPFDEQARGTRPGAGAGIVVLKLLARALADGDTIRAVIRGAAVNNDGAGKMGYSAPSVEGQARAIEAAQAQAGVNPESIGYVEAHGTATPLGDPIEIAALDRVFGAHTGRRGFCAIGSVKSNIGHLDAAAGVAGLIKTVLALEHEAIPPSLHFHKPNPQIDFAGSAFFVNSRLREWKSGEAPRRAGVSSFGIGGTNAHVVLEEAPARTLTAASRPCQALVLSARTSAALESSASALGRFLREHPEVDLADAAYTLQVGRARFSHRRALVCRSREEAIAALEAGQARAISSVEEALSRPVAFLFSGQGSQHPGMAAGLYRSEPLFREWLDQSAAILRPHLGCDLTELLYPAPGQEEEAAARLTETRFAQPALFAVEYALARMWMGWGIAPDAMLGHSIGEYVAACLAGVFSLEDALVVVAARGRLMQEAAPGAMLAVSQPAARLTEWLTGGVSLAAENTPSLCTLSGAHPAIRAVEEALQARQVNCRRLHTSHAFHSEMMDPVLEAFREVVSQIRLAEPNRPYISNVTGTWIRAEEATDPGYWARHLRQTVRFADGLRELFQDPRRVLLEVGPGQALTTFARETGRLCGGGEAHPSLPHPQRPQPELPYVLETLARLWASGITVDWQGFHRGEMLHRVPLPAYPFERKSYWVEPKASSGPPSRTGKKPDIADWFYAPSWKRSVASSLPAERAPGPWLVFLDQDGVGQEILSELAARGEVCVGVIPGQRFARLGSGLCSIDPASRGDYELLLRALEATGQTPQSVLHLWNATRGAAGETPRWASFYSLLHLAQAWDDVQQGRALTVTIVSDGLHAVNAGDGVEPDKALLLGPCKVIPQEYPAIRCRSIDLAPAGDNGPSPVHDLLLEPQLIPGAQVVAYRGGRRWEQTFEPLRLEAEPDARRSRLRERGVYLITGGLGGIGLALARYLAEGFRARLVLTARSPLPPPAEWDRWLGAHGAGDEISGKIRKIRELEQAGGEVAVFAADVADPAGMREVFEQARARFGPFHGVIHAAGVAGTGMIGTKTREMAERVFSPKVSGTVVLAALLEKEDPDFLLLCSSVDAIQGAFGAVDYCSANAFLDAYSAAHPGVVSVNWDTWQEVGMAVNTEVPPDLRAARIETLRHGIKPSEGVEAFRRVLAAALPEVAVVTRDLPSMLAEAGQPRKAEAVDRTAAGIGTAEAGHPRPELSNSFAAPENECQRKLVEIWKGQLGIDQIGIDDNFFELGGHSLLATGVLSRLRKSFDVTIPLRAIFERPTVRTLATAIMEAQASAASQRPGESEGREVIEL